MKQIGKIGKINIQANKKLKQIYLERGITACEARLEDCMGNSFLFFHHCHKRNWYIKKPRLLSDFSQSILVCQNCHDKIENNYKLSEQLFKKLR